MHRSTDQVARLRRQVAALQAKVRKARDQDAQRPLLSELIGVTYALECAQARTHERPSIKQRHRTLAARRRAMQPHYATVLARYLDTTALRTSARSAASSAASMGV